MIIGSTKKLTVGEIYTPEIGIGITDAFGNIRKPQPLYILREATEKEWYDEVVLQGNNNPSKNVGGIDICYFYEIITD